MPSMAPRISVSSSTWFDIIRLHPLEHAHELVELAIGVDVDRGEAAVVAGMIATAVTRASELTKGEDRWRMENSEGERIGWSYQPF